MTKKRQKQSLKYAAKKVIKFNDAIPYAIYIYNTIHTVNIQQCYHPYMCTGDWSCKVILSEAFFFCSTIYTVEIELHTCKTINQINTFTRIFIKMFKQFHLTNEKIFMFCHMLGNLFYIYVTPSSNITLSRPAVIYLH